jgi:catechol 2,3-dioxygenase-like lactoylglutathione lyase family enzyme
MSKVEGLGHVAISVKDIEASIAFYNLFGMKVDKRDHSDRPDGSSAELAIISVGDCALELIQPSNGAITGTGCIPHLCLRVSGIEDVVADLEKKGVTTFAPGGVQTRKVFGGLKNIMLSGPDGEILELLEAL